ncbi:MAG: type II secretion system major pseudopilin GspG [Magnetospiraceae bacterium]
MKNSGATLRNLPTGQRGFTLLELLVVLAILGLIALFAVPQVTRLLGGAKSDAAAIQVTNLSSILDLYRIETGRFPTDAEGLEALRTKPAEAKGWNGPYVQKAEMLVDPWGNPYQYRFPGEHGEYDIWSFGADGTEGGSGEDADVVSW